MPPYTTDHFTTTGDIPADVTRFLKAHGCPKTAAHCAKVAARAGKLAERFGGDPLKAKQAGYLHDISAVIPDDERIEFARRQAVEILPEELQYPMIIHQKLSVVLAREVFGVTDGEVLGAIGCHTTLRANPTLLDKIVFVADKIAWDQDGTPPYLGRVVESLDVSLEHGALAYINYLWERREQLKVLHPWLVQAREFLLR